jgi:hypothetical protein
MAGGNVEFLTSHFLLTLKLVEKYPASQNHYFALICTFENVSIPF